MKVSKPRTFFVRRKKIEVRLEKNYISTHTIAISGLLERIFFFSRKGKLPICSKIQSATGSKWFATILN